MHACRRGGVSTSRAGTAFHPRTCCARRDLATANPLDRGAPRRPRHMVPQASPDVVTARCQVGSLFHAAGRVQLHASRVGRHRQRGHRHVLVGRLRRVGLRSLEPLPEAVVHCVERLDDLAQLLRSRPFNRVLALAVVADAPPCRHWNQGSRGTGYSSGFSPTRASCTHIEIPEVVPDRGWPQQQGTPCQLAHSRQPLSTRLRLQPAARSRTEERAARAGEGTPSRAPWPPTSRAGERDGARQPVRVAGGAVEDLRRDRLEDVQRDAGQRQHGVDARPIGIRASSRRPSPSARPSRWQGWW